MPQIPGKLVPIPVNFLVRHMLFVVHEVEFVGSDRRRDRSRILRFDLQIVVAEALNLELNRLVVPRAVQPRRKRLYFLILTLNVQKLIVLLILFLDLLNQDLVIYQFCVKFRRRPLLVHRRVLHGLRDRTR